MKNMRSMAIALIVSLALCVSVSNVKAKEEAGKIGSDAKVVKGEEGKGGAVAKIGKGKTSTLGDASKAIKEIAALPKQKIPPVLLKEASAVIIIPNASKHAFMVKGGSNTGFLLMHDKSGSWSNPVLISISGGTLGWQIAGDPMDIILVIRNSKIATMVMKGKLTLDTKIGIVPGRLALTMGGASEEELKADITSYIRSHGVFSEDSVVAGTSIQVDVAANEAFYATPKVSAVDIVSGKVAAKSPEELKTLQKLLSEYAVSK